MRWEYFVSYYDYYQPEAYIPSTDTYIEKDSAINDEIDRLRHSATAALSERRDVIIVASVSCIYSLGDPIDAALDCIREGMQMEREELMRRLVTLQYERNDVNFVRNKFRVRGDVVEINLAYASETAIRVEFFGDEVDRISEVNPLTGEKKASIRHVAIFPASHYIVSNEKKAEGLRRIRMEMDAQVERFRAEGKLIEAQRIAQRTNYDVGNAAGGWHLQRGGKLFRSAGRARAGVYPHHTVGLFPGRFSSFCGREPCNAATASGYVRRRFCAQEKPCGLWLPPALCL